MDNFHLTQNQFVNNEITKLGWDEVERLFDLGFEPTLTNEGWRWIQEPVNPTPRRSNRTRTLLSY